MRFPTRCGPLLTLVLVAAIAWPWSVALASAEPGNRAGAAGDRPLPRGHAGKPARRTASEPTVAAFNLDETDDGDDADPHATLGGYDCLPEAFECDGLLIDSAAVPWSPRFVPTGRYLLLRRLRC